ncbi:MAG TPA: efflux RND transporter periplasmic adaptor subunit [Candidatus Kapabacteria bacterium]|nr:efflux RND transporter periplasmic adaptor subunit [Candidatus Kapabacteria bacterium]
MKKRIMYIIPPVLLIGGGLWWMFFSANDSQSTLTVTPKKGNFRVTVTVTGELRAKTSTEIMGPQGMQSVGIYNMKIANLVPEGTTVKIGDFVAEIDKTDISGKIREAQLAIQKAESHYTQVKLDTTLTLSAARDELTNLKYALEEQKLLREQSVYEAPAIIRQAEIAYEKSRRTYDQAKINYSTKVKQAVAKMLEAETDLAKERQKFENLSTLMSQFYITAPQAGMVIYDREWNGRKRVVGSTISPWDPTVATLPDLSVMESITYINEVDIQKIAINQSVQIGLDAIPDKKLTGTVTTVANIGEQRPNSESKVFEVKIQIHQKDSTLRPAMTTSNTILITTIPNVMYIPIEAVRSEGKQSFVYVKSGKKAEKRNITLGIMNENEVIVKSGLTEKDVIFLVPPDDIAEQ